MTKKHLFRSCFLILICIGIAFGLFRGNVYHVAAAELAVERPELYDPFELLENADELRGINERENYTFDEELDVAYGKIYKFTQIHDGIEVYGTQLVVMVDDRGNKELEGKYIEIPSLSKSLDADEAIEKVKEFYGGNILSIQLKIYAYEQSPELAYETITSANGGTKVFVSALDGSVLSAIPLNGSIDMTQTDAFGNVVSVNVEYDNRRYYLADHIKNIYVVDAKNSEDLNIAEDYTSTNGVFEPIAVSAYSSVIKAYDFYTDANNIGVSMYGINGRNDDISSNYLENNEVPIFIFMHYGNNFENAACSYISESNMAFMYVGDGNINGRIYQLGKAVDVLAHEYQHAVTSLTTPLEYVGDSGALNEAFSDIFGALVEGYSPSDERFWRIGEDAASAHYNEIRSMIGGTIGQVYSLSQKFVCRWHRNGNHDENCDYNGVHTNSTIITHLQYELCQKLPEFFTREKIGTLWYSTLCALSPTATFEDFARCFFKTATKLEYPADVCDIIEQTLIEDGFVQNELTHSVKFYDDNDNLISEIKVFDGEPIEASQIPLPPEKPSTEYYEYVFEGWSSFPEIITEDIEIKAQYSEHERTYEVTLINSDGKVFDSFYYSYGDIIDTTAFGEPPAPADNYVFDDWYIDTNYSAKVDGQLVQGDMTFYARFQRVQNEEQSGCASCASVGFGDYGGFIGGALLLIPVLFIKRRQKT